MIEKNLIKRSFFVIAILVLLEWKKSLKYKPESYPYQEMSETEVWNEYEKNPDFRVIDQNFTILKTPSMEDHKITLLIKSAPGNIDKRARTRKQLEPYKNQFNFFFVIGTFEDPKLVEAINSEYAQGKDILQISIKDGYRHLIYKVLAAFQWLYQNRSPKLEWMVSMDDDLHFDVEEFLNSSLTWDQNPNSLICNRVYRNFPPIRDPKESLSSKWSIPVNEWPIDRYPDFCLGWIYAVKPTLGLQFALASRSTPIISIDDMYITGIIRERLRDHVKIKPMVEGWTNYLNCPAMILFRIYLLPTLAYPRELAEAWPWIQIRFFACQIIEFFTTSSYCQNLF